MKNIKIRNALWLGAFLAAVLLGGCQKRPATEDVPPMTNATPDTAPSVSVTLPSTPPVTELPDATQRPSLEPVTRLASIKWRTVPQLLSLGDGKVLACRNYYEKGTGIVNFLDILDVYEDTVLVQDRNDSPMELVEQQFEDGCFVLRDDRSSSFRVYDPSLRITGSFSAPNVDGRFSPDRKHYYFVENNVLYRMDTGTGSHTRMTLEHDPRLKKIIGGHPDRDILVAEFYLSFYNETSGICAIDCTTGKLLLLNDVASHLWFDADTFYAAVTNDQVYGNDIYYGSLSGGNLQKASAAALGSDTVSYTMLPGSGILMLRTVDEDNLSTTVYDLSKGGISAKLAQYDYLTSTLGSIYLAEEELIFGVYPDGYDFSPVVINPRALSYEQELSLEAAVWPALVDRSIISNYEAEVAGPALPEQLLPLRQQADALEKKYSVKILMENQVLGLCGSYATLEPDPEKISNALTVLDQALALYPEGFFGQFQNGISEGGLYFCLTGKIHGALDPVGKAQKNGIRYELALNIGSGALDRTIHHELWHAIEMKISTDRFEHPQWDAANPPGFLYLGRYSADYRQLTQWTYSESADRCYFVDAYSRINAGEDRARIMEYVMATDASALMRSSALLKKLEIMSKTLREQFDTAGWQAPHWERYLTDVS